MLPRSGAVALCHDTVAAKQFTAGCFDQFDDTFQAQVSDGVVVSYDSPEYREFLRSDRRCGELTDMKNEWMWQWRLAIYKHQEEGKRLCAAVQSHEASAGNPKDKTYLKNKHNAAERKSECDSGLKYHDALAAIAAFTAANGDFAEKLTRVKDAVAEHERGGRDETDHEFVANKQFLTEHGQYLENKKFVTSHERKFYFIDHEECHLAKVSFSPSQEQTISAMIWMSHLKAIEKDKPVTSIVAELAEYAC